MGRTPEQQGLDVSAGTSVFPSTLNPRQRIELLANDADQYSKLYQRPHSASVHERLHTDSFVRQRRATSARPYKEGGGVVGNPSSLSGYNSNSTRPSAVYTTSSFKPGHSHVSASDTPVETLHPMVARRYLQKYPLEFKQNIRPDAETTNQTLRMMGTYQSDHDHAARFDMHIPHCMPGGKGWYHPDVRLTGASLNRTAENPAYRQEPWGRARPASARPVATQGR